MWKNKILSLENLCKRRCNQLPTTTCVLCHSNIESVDHLFIQSPFARRVRYYFVNLLHLPVSPLSMNDIWSFWRLGLRPSIRDMGVLVVKVIVWNIWLVRNDCIFNANVVPSYSFILKINRMFLSWVSAVFEGSQAKLEDSMAFVRWSLDFLNPRVEETGWEQYIIRGGASPRWKLGLS